MSFYLNVAVRVSTFSRKHNYYCHSSATEFNNFHVKYDEKMADGTYKFHAGEIEKLKEMIGDRDKIILFFLGYENHLRALCK